MPGADGLKTGHTDEAGYGFTGSAEQNGRRIVMVVAGLPSFNQRDRGIGALHAMGLRRLAVAAFARTRMSGSAKRRCRAAMRPRVGLVAPRALAVTYPQGLGQNIHARIVYQGPLQAPIAQGQHVADLVVETGEGPPQVTPLVAENAVGEAGFFRRAWRGLLGLVGLA